jgi:hypothetical protein
MLPKRDLTIARRSRRPTYGAHRACLARGPTAAASLSRWTCRRPQPATRSALSQRASAPRIKSAVAWCAGLRAEDVPEGRERESKTSPRRDRSVIAMAMWPAAGISSGTSPRGRHRARESPRRAADEIAGGRGGHVDGRRRQRARFIATSARPPTGSTALASRECFSHVPAGTSASAGNRHDAPSTRSLGVRGGHVDGRHQRHGSLAAIHDARPQGPPRLPRASCLGLQTLGLRERAVPAGTSVAFANRQDEPSTRSLVVAVDMWTAAAGNELGFIVTSAPAHGLHRGCLARISQPRPRGDVGECCR